MGVLKASVRGRYTAQSQWKYTVLQISAAHSQPLLKTRARQVSAEYHNPLSSAVLSEQYTAFSRSSQNTESNFNYAILFISPFI